MFYYGVFYYYFLHVIFVYNTCSLMSKMIPTQNNLTILDLIPVQLVLLVPDWVGCCVA